MRKIVFLMLSIMMLLIPIVSFGAEHAPGCTNQSFDTSCCTKEFNISAEEGYEVIDVIVNGVSQGPINYYKFDTVTSDQTIEVITAPLAPTLATCW